ncbi:MAG: hypothetical protein P4M14_07735 [Gammaproteobacteria bacterium]|nr:hypothetical protein [Gammaproteobacteria bacterium]
MKTRPPHQSTPYRTAQTNPAYAALFHNMHQEQASRIIQRAWRGRHDLTPKSNYTETLTGPLTLHFIQEPVGPEAEQHGKQITAGKWLEVNYADPEFVRNAFKALRLGYIANEKTLATALLLHAAVNQYGDKRIKQYRFDEKGPYHQSSITYADATHLEDFQNRLCELPVAEQCYFSINFSREDEAAFIYEGLSARKLHETMSQNVRQAFTNIIDRYLRKHRVNTALREQLVANITSNNEAQREAATNKLLAEIIRIEQYLLPFLLLSSTSTDSKTKQNRITLSLLTNIYAVGEQLPSLAISPDFDENHPGSPLLCLILPTTSALIELQRALHGSDATEPFFTVGQISPSLLRIMDEFPARLNRAEQTRGVELIHPDTQESPELHGAKINHFLAIYHDLFHCWRNGSNPYKPMLRHVRQLLENEKRFFTSKAIWSLTDMDTGIGWLTRNALKNGNATEIQRTKNYAFYKILSLAGPSFFTETNNHDNSLLLLIDIISHASKWSVFSEQIQLFFQQYGFPELISALNLPMTYDIKIAYREMKNIIDENSESKNQQTTTSRSKYYVLRYRLRKHATGRELCDQLDTLGLDKLFSWHRNGGLYLIDLPAVTLASLKPEELSEQISLALNLYHQRARQQGRVLNDAFCLFFHREKVATGLTIKNGDHIIAQFNLLTPSQRLRLLALHETIDSSMFPATSVFRKEKTTGRYIVDVNWLKQLEDKKIGEFAEIIGMPENLFRAKIKFPLNTSLGYRPKR